MTCDPFRNDLSAWVDHELLPERRAQVAAHLATCADCTDVVRQFAKLAALIGGWPTPGAPAGLAGDSARRVAALARIRREPRILPSADQTILRAFPALSGRHRPAKNQLEFRIVTVLVCDVIVIGGANPTQPNPDDPYAIARERIAACGAVADTFGGRVVDRMDARLLAYFGLHDVLPHNDVAVGAVRAGLRMIEQVGRAFDHRTGVGVGAQVGIATGAVPVEHRFGDTVALAVSAAGAMSAPARRLQSLADGLHAFAPLDGVVVNQSTRDRLGGRFDCRDLGPLQMPDGLTQTAWRVVGELAAETCLPAMIE